MPACACGKASAGGVPEGKHRLAGSRRHARAAGRGAQLARRTVDGRHRCRWRPRDHRRQSSVVEPANALAAGVDLVAAMLDVAGDVPARERSPGGAGVRTRRRCSRSSGPPNSAAREAPSFAKRSMLFARGDYAGSVEELTPIAGDPVAAVPVVAALVASLIHPPLWRKFHAARSAPTRSRRKRGTRSWRQRTDFRWFSAQLGNAGVVTRCPSSRLHVPSQSLSRKAVGVHIAGRLH